MLHPGDRFFEYVTKWQERPQDFLWPFFRRPERITKGDSSILVGGTVPPNLPPFINDFAIELPASAISRNPDRFAPVRTPLAISDPEGHAMTVAFTGAGASADGRTWTGAHFTASLAGAAIPAIPPGVAPQTAIIATRTADVDTEATETVEIVATDSEGLRTTQTGPVSILARRIAPIQCPESVPTLYLTGGQRNVEVDVAAWARRNPEFGYRLVSIQIPPDQSEVLSYRHAPTTPLPGRVYFTVGSVTTEQRFQIVWTAQHTIGDTTPAVCRVNVVVRPDRAFEWIGCPRSIQVRARSGSTDGEGEVPTFRTRLESISIPSSGNTYRIKTPPPNKVPSAPEATDGGVRAVATIDTSGGALGSFLNVDFTEPYPFTGRETDEFALVVAGRRTVPSGADAKLPLYAEADCTFNFEVLPPGATLSGDACELAVAAARTLSNPPTGAGTSDAPFQYSVGAGGARSIDLRELVHPVVGGGAILLAEGAAQVIEVHSNHPDIFTISFDDAEGPGEVTIEGRGLGVAMGWARVKNRLCPDDSAVRVYFRVQVNVLYAIWPQKVIAGHGGIYGAFGSRVIDHWGIPATVDNTPIRDPRVVGDPTGSSLVLGFDEFLPLSDDSVRWTRVADYDPDTRFSEYAHTAGWCSNRGSLRSGSGGSMRTTGRRGRPTSRTCCSPRTLRMMSSPRPRSRGRRTSTGRGLSAGLLRGMCLPTRFARR